MHGLGEFPLGVYVEGWVVWWVALSLWCVCGLGELGRQGGLLSGRGGPSQADTTDWGSLQGPWSGSRDCSEH